jgi:hypothetical protein
LGQAGFGKKQNQNEKEKGGMKFNSLRLFLSMELGMPKDTIKWFGEIKAYQFIPRNAGTASSRPPFRYSGPQVQIPERGF